MGLAALSAQNVVSPSGALQTGDETLTLRVSGAFESEQDILAVNFVANGRLIRLRDIAQVHRSYADPPQPMMVILSAVDGKILTSLPLFPFMEMKVVPLCRHPSSLRDDDR